MDTIRVVAVSDPTLEIATATMDDSGKISYTGVEDVLSGQIDRALAGAKNRRAAFRALMKKGWSNGYLKIELKG